MKNKDPRAGVVALTHERPQELERTLRRLEAWPEAPALIVVDNGTLPATAEVVRRFQRAQLMRCPGNPGATTAWNGCVRPAPPSASTTPGGSPARDRRARHLATTRNRFRLAWLRLPWRLAWHETRKVWRDGQAQGVPGAALWSALAGLPWVLAHRRVLPPAVVGMIVTVHGGPPPVQRRRLAVMPGAQR